MFINIISNITINGIILDFRTEEKSHNRASIHLVCNSNMTNEKSNFHYLYEVHEEYNNYVSIFLIQLLVCNYLIVLYSITFHNCTSSKIPLKDTSRFSNRHGYANLSCVSLLFNDKLPLSFNIGVPPHVSYAL